MANPHFGWSLSGRELCAHCRRYIGLWAPSHHPHPPPPTSLQPLHPSRGNPWHPSPPPSSKPPTGLLQGYKDRGENGVSVAGGDSGGPVLLLASAATLGPRHPPLLPPLVGIPPPSPPSAVLPTQPTHRHTACTAQCTIYNELYTPYTVKTAFLLQHPSTNTLYTAQWTNDMKKITNENTQHCTVHMNQWTLHTMRTVTCQKQCTMHTASARTE